MPAVAAAVPLAEVTPQPAPMPVSVIPAPEPKGQTAVIETTMGTLRCRLFDKEAPVGVANFVGLATGTKAFKSPATHAMVRGRSFMTGLVFGGWFRTS